MIRFYMHKKHKRMQGTKKNQKALKAQKHNQTKAQKRKQANKIKKCAQKTSEWKKVTCFLIYVKKVSTMEILTQLN